MNIADLWVRTPWESNLRINLKSNKISLTTLLFTTILSGLYSIEEIAEVPRVVFVCLSLSLLPSTQTGGPRVYSLAKYKRLSSQNVTLPFLWRTLHQ